MDTLQASELRQLLAATAGPCVTLCMPTHVVGDARQQDEVRLKNLTNQVERQLADGWLRETEARQWVAPIRELVEDEGFWENRSHGLALFLDHNGLRRFRLPIRLNELAVVDNRFHIKPVLPLFTGRAKFYVLALSQHRVRLFEANEFQMEEVDVALPQRLEESLNLDGADRGAQSHFATPDGRGKEGTVFHGQGGVKETHKEELALFFRMIDEALEPILRDHKTPVVLAGVDYLLPIFREISHYPQIVETELTGNFDYRSAHEIHKDVWPLVKTLFDSAREQAVSKFHDQTNAGKATDVIHEALAAAFEGRVETLFVALDRQCWGRYDAQGYVTALHGEPEPGDDDLLDAAAVQTLLHGGQVYGVESGKMPSSTVLAAVLRY